MNDSSLQQRPSPPPPSSLPLRSTATLTTSHPTLEGEAGQHHHHQHHDFTNTQHLLDDSHHILNNEPSVMSPMLKIRRDSADDHHNTVFAHPDAAWNGFNFNTPVTSMDSGAAAHAFVQHRNQPCLELNTTQPMAYPQVPWPMSASSETFSPTGGIDHIPDFNNPFAVNQNHYAMVTPGPLQQSAFPTSPPFSTSSSDGHELRTTSVQVRAQSPAFVSSTTMLRRDGIRKKNARFDIPVERNLRTIDQLINQTNDEAELKELKQQKRLLRNRQAALDSRQRKKLHTERLEEEKKHFVGVLNDLEESCSDFKTREAEWLREKEAWAHTQQQYQSWLENLHMEKEELVRLHTIETGDLRRKNAQLMEQLQRPGSIAMSAQQSHTSMSGDYPEFDPMTLNTWDNLSNDFTIENQAVIQHPIKAQETEKPAASALLLMLLLCGAWVASRNDSSASSILPAIPDHMRAASATVLDNLYKDSGIQLDGVSSFSKSITGHSTKTVLSALESGGALSSSLDGIYRKLTTPSAQQLKDQAFSMTPSQYYGLTSGDTRYQQAYFDYQNKSMGGPVQQDAVTLADTYTRSLLRDKVSTQVLKDFARMVAQSNNIKSPATWKAEPM